MRPAVLTAFIIATARPGTVRSTLSRAVAQLREQPGLSALFPPRGDEPPYSRQFTHHATSATRRVRYA